MDSTLHQNFEAVSSGVLAWLLTYAIHSTLLLGAAWLLTSRGWRRSNSLKERIWKAALIGGLLTATFQGLSGWQPAGGRFELARLGMGIFSEAGKLPARSTSITGGPDNIKQGLRITDGRVIISNSSAIVLGESSGIEVRPLDSQNHAAPSADTDLNRRQKSYAIYYPKPRWANWALGAWAIIVGLLGVYLGLTQWRLMKPLGGRRSVAGPLLNRLTELGQAAGFRHQIQLTCSARIAGPIAFQWSEICLPERALTDLSFDQQESMLAHELAHLVRRDPAWMLVYAIFETVFFFQPLNHLARRRLQEEAEYLCDDWAVAQTGCGLSLAKCLAEVAEWVQTRPQPSVVSGMGGSNSTLVLRVQRLLEDQPRAQSQSWRAWSVLLAASLLLLVAWSAPAITADRKSPVTTFSNGVGYIRIEVPSNGDPVLVLPGK